MLNVVNFGGGAYVIYAEILPSGEIEVDPEPYSDTFDRPARLLPIEAKALVAAIDLIGRAHADLRSAREKVVDALGFDPGRGGAADRLAEGRRQRSRTRSSSRSTRAGCSRSSTGRRPRTATPSAVVEPYALFNGAEALVRRRLGPRRRPAAPLPAGPDQARVGAGSSASSAREGLNPIADIGGWPRTGRSAARASARVLISAEQARWAREQRTVLAELPDGRIIVEITFKGIDFLVREVLKEAGDAVVLEPADAREAVLAAAEGLIARAT